MTKRMQVLLSEGDYQAVRRVARRKGLTLAEWVRQVLKEACRQEPQGDVDRKLAAVRRAVEHQFPTGDIGQINEDIERGYQRGLGE